MYLDIQGFVNSLAEAGRIAKGVVDYTVSAIRNYTREPTDRDKYVFNLTGGPIVRRNEKGAGVDDETSKMRTYWDASPMDMYSNGDTHLAIGAAEFDRDLDSLWEVFDGETRKDGYSWAIDKVVDKIVELEDDKLREKAFVDVNELGHSEGANAVLTKAVGKSLKEAKLDKASKYATEIRKPAEKPTSQNLNNEQLYFFLDNYFRAGELEHFPDAAEAMEILRQRGKRYTGTATEHAIEIAGQLKPKQTEGYKQSLTKYVKSLLNSAENPEVGVFEALLRIGDYNLLLKELGRFGVFELDEHQVKAVALDRIYGKLGSQDHRVLARLGNEDVLKSWYKNFLGGTDAEIDGYLATVDISEASQKIGKTLDEMDRAERHGKFNPGVLGDIEFDMNSMRIIIDRIETLEGDNQFVSDARSMAKQLDSSTLPGVNKRISRYAVNQARLTAYMMLGVQKNGSPSAYRNKLTNIGTGYRFFVERATETAARVDKNLVAEVDAEIRSIESDVKDRQGSAYVSMSMAPVFVKVPSDGNNGNNNQGAGKRWPMKTSMPNRIIGPRRMMKNPAKELR